jgi:hypothetical protein
MEAVDGMEIIVERYASATVVSELSCFHMVCPGTWL